jgi:hypothetical protein
MMHEEALRAYYGEDTMAMVRLLEKLKLQAARRKIGGRG